MPFNLADLTIKIDNLDLVDVFSAWRWRTKDIKGLIMISRLGDMFLLGSGDAVYWLQTDDGELSKIADDVQHFEQLLNLDEYLDDWFLPELIKKLEQAGQHLGPNQVYSYKKLPVIGGEYDVNNIEPTDISVHFALTGQICEKIRHLPDGTKVKLTFRKGEESGCPKNGFF